MIDPRLTQSVGTFQFAGLTSNRLVRYLFSDETANPGDLSLRGDLAESWSASADQRVWTFKLRQGVKWQNLAPVNGRSSSRRTSSTASSSTRRGVQTLTFQEVEATETPDKYTVRVHLKTPNALFAHNLAEPIALIFAKEVLEEDGDLKKRMIGTRPYILKEHTRKVRVVLQRNPDYFDKGRPYIDEYIILSTPDAATRLAAFRTGQSDFIWLASPSEVEIARKTNPNVQVQSFHNTLAPFGLALAQDKPPYNDVRVRRAISMAIDRQKQVDTVFEGHGIPGWGIPYIYYQDKAPTLKARSWWQYRRTRPEAHGRGGTGQGLRDDVVLLRVFSADELAGAARATRPQEEPEHRHQDPEARLHHLLRPLRRRQVGRHVLGLPVRTRDRLDERSYQYMHSKSPRTSSASTIRSSTS
jgi:ABC-type transport system substrate-binding protein